MLPAARHPLRRAILPASDRATTASRPCTGHRTQPLLDLLQRWIPASEDPPDTDRFNREILRRLQYRDAGEFSI